MKPSASPLLARLVAVLALLIAFVAPRAAWAEEPASAANAASAVVSAPPDVKLVLQPQTIAVPPVPATYQRKDLGWLKLAYVPAAHERVQPLIADAEQIKAQLADELGQPVLEHVEVRVARTYDEMASLAPPDVGVPPGASGVAYPGLRLVLLTLTEPRTNEGVDLGEVFRHELAHVALEDAVTDHHVPRWFNEGLAMHLSGEHPLARVQALWNATLSKQVIPLADLDRSFPYDAYETSVAYAESGDFVRFLLRRSDRERFASLIARTRGGEPFDRALADAYGTDLRKLEYEWREELARRYTFLPILTGGSLVWVLVIGAMVLGWVRKKRRDKVTLAQWAREEAAEDAALRAAQVEASEVAELAALHGMGGASLPKIEHDGTWHTLH